jgi:hypothetical protein
LALTAGTDTFVGTSGNDTFTAAAGTLGSSDQLLDQSTTDNDTLNAVITNANKTGITPTLLNIENVNLDLDVFTSAQFDADNTTGATITGSSSKLGFNGEFAVSNVADNNVTAGENVTDLTVSGLEAGMVDTGAAETADVNTDSTNDAANVTVNGDIDLTVQTSDTLNLTATADAEVDLTEASGSASTDNQVDTIVGAGEGVITLNTTVDAVGGDETSGIDTVVIGSGQGDVDATDFDVATIEVATDMSGSLTVADAASVEVTEEQAETSGLTVSGSSATNTATVSSALSSVGTLTFSGLAAAELNLSASNAGVTSLTGGTVALDVNVEDGATISTLSGDNLTLAGSGDVTVSSGDAADVLDASALEGALELTSSGSGDQEIAGGQGDNDITFGATVSGFTATYAGQSGNDEVTFGATASGSTIEASFAGGDNTINLATSFAGQASIVGADGADTLKLGGATDADATIAANLGAGDDVVELASGSYSGDLTLAFGEGSDTLLANAADLSDATAEITGLEAIEIGGSGTATFAAEQLNGQEDLSVSSEDGSASLVIELAASGGDSVDLSGISLNNEINSDVSATITGGSGSDTIIGTQGNDTITGADGVDTLTGGEGDDTFVLGNESGSGIDVILDLNADQDTIQVGSGGNDASGFTNLGDLTDDAFADLNALLIASGGAFGSGSAADATDEAFQFAFEGKTYLFVDAASDGYDSAADTVVEITGFTGTFEAADIQIA